MAAPPISERHLPHFHRRAPVKEAVRAATTANITISTALNNGDSLDGLTLATGDRVLVKDQSTGSQNGIYVVGVTPVRDYDESTDDPAFGYLVYVREGTANGGTLWKNTNTSAPTIDTTSLTFAAFTASVSFATPSIALGSSAAAGAASTVIRSDSTIAAFDATSPSTQALGDSAVVGTAAFAARRDHKHAMPALSTATPIVASGSGATGTGIPSSREDHVHPAGAGSGTVTTVEEVDGSPTDSAVTKIVFPNGTLSITSHVATYTPTGGGSLTSAYLGYNTVGGTEENGTLNRVLAKSVTPGSNCILQSIGVYFRETADSQQFLNVALYEDNAGALGKFIAANISPNLAPTNNSTFGGGTASVARWVDVPLLAALTGGTTYWIAWQWNAPGGSTPTVRQFYDGSGTDRRYDASGPFFVDGGRFSETTDSRKYSTRALTIS